MIDTLVGFCNNNNLEIIGLYGLKRYVVCGVHRQEGFRYLLLIPACA